MIFKNTISLKGVLQHYEKLKISEAVEFDVPSQSWKKSLQVLHLEVTKGEL